MRHCATTIHSGASKVCIYKFVSPHMRVCRAALRVCAVLLNSQQTHAHTQSSKRKGVRCVFVYIDTILITKSISKHEGLGLFGCWARSSTPRPRLVGRGPLKITAQNVRSSITRPRGTRRRRALGVYKRDSAQENMETTRGRVRAASARSHQEAARSNRRVAPSSVPMTSQWCAQEGTP